MSVITNAVLQNETGNLFDLALAKGIIHAGGIYSTKQSMYFYKEYLLDFSSCSPDLWSQDKKRMIETGVVDYAQQKLDGTYGVRRDLTEKEVASLSLWPVHKDQDGGILLFSNYDHGAIDSAAFYVSKAFPADRIFVTGDTEGESVFSYMLLNGEVVPNIVCGFDVNVQPGNWCIPQFDNTLKTPDGKTVEIGIYREPDNGSYTLQVFIGDDVVLCQEIDM